MTDPERISKRSPGLAAQLLQAGAEEQPGDAGMQRTLAALGVTAGVVTTTSTAGAVAGTAKMTGVAGASGVGATATSGAVKAVSATLLAKWIGLGVVGGIGLAGAAAVATSAAAPPASVSQTVVAVPRVVSPAPVALATPAAVAAKEEAAPVRIEPVPAPVIAAPHPSGESASSASTSSPALEVGAPLAAEVAHVDRARALLAAGQSEQGLALLRSYEHDFPEARLLPEVLFLRMETCDRLGRKTEARAAAQRLLDGFPQSPHASRARQLLAR